MSAFVAVFNRDSAPVEHGLIEAMLAAGAYPDADGQATWVQGAAALASQHFWITPEEYGELQPIRDPESGCVLVGPARLDNRAELLGSLAAAWAEPLSDAGLILRAYLRWGTDCPRRLLGDYAFVIWDPGEQRCFAARDALGAEELYTYLDSGRWMAASRISAILAHPAVQPRLNEVKVAGYLALQWGDDRNTFYEGIYHLPPGCCLLATAESCREWRYWDVEPGETLRYPNPGDYADHYRELLTQAVRCRLRSAHPVGISLSGGLDSSTLACLAAGLFPEAALPQQGMWSFSYVFDELASCDERAYIQPVIEQARRSCTWQPVFIPGDALWPAPERETWWIERDYPYQDPYYYLLQAVFQSARQNGVRLLLSGFYGDDLYAGEAHWFGELLLDGRPLQAVKSLLAARRQVSLKNDLFDYGLRSLIPDGLKAPYRRLRPVSPSWMQWIHPQLAAQADLLKLEAEGRLPRKSALPGRQARYLALFRSGYPESVTLLQDLAHQNGVQYTFPFLDRRIVEFVLRLPAEQIAWPGQPRRVLRQATEGLLPEAVRQRPDKTLLYELYDRGIYGENFPAIRKILSQSQAREREFIRADWLASELSQTQGRTQDGLILWLVLCLENWLHNNW